MTMASAVKAKLQNLSSSNTTAEAAETEKYKLLVTAGPSYDESTHRTVNVNTDRAVSIENNFVRAKIKVRVRGFKGLPSSTPASSTYFDDPAHERDLYSIGFSFVPKQDLPSVDTVWGNDFDHPIRSKLPPGFNTAFKIVKEFIDPGLECDAYADEPWLYGPSLSCWFAFKVGEKVEEGDDFAAPDDEEVLTEGGDGEGEEVRRRLGIPENGDKRRKFFLSAQHRQDFVFEKGRAYQGDFYNPYIDFPNFSLKLPGFTMKVVKYIDQKSHCLRYVFKQRKTGDVYFNVNFHLLWGEKLEQANRKDRQERRLEAEGRHDEQTNGSIGVAIGVAADSSEGTGSADQQDREPSAPNDDSTQTQQRTRDDADSGSHSQKASSAPEQPQLHPGDQDAAAKYDSSQIITRMLQSTSTSDQQAKKTGVLGEGVD